METSTLTPCCFYPTTTVFVDDDTAFLKGLVHNISQKTPCKAMTEPLKAIDYIKANQLKSAFIRKLSNDDMEDMNDALLTNINVRSIRDLIFDKQRFDDVTVAIIDYAMPKLNGLMVCKELNIPPLKKAMLTGQADTNIAVQAFNDKLINRFYVKDIAFLQGLAKEISQLQKEYFIGLTDAIISDAIYDRYPSMRCLKDKVFAQFFSDLCEKKKIVEYYLTDAEGSFILFDENAKPSYLSVKTAADLQYYYEIAFDAPNVGSEVLNAIQNKTKVPYFLTEKNHETPPKDWGPYLHKATCLEGDSNYYIAYIEDNPLYEEAEQPNVFSFSEYMRAQKAKR